MSLPISDHKEFVRKRRRCLPRQQALPCIDPSIVAPTSRCGHLGQSRTESLTQRRGQPTPLRSFRIQRENSCGEPPSPADLSDHQNSNISTASRLPAGSTFSRFSPVVHRPATRGPSRASPGDFSPALVFGAAATVASSKARPSTRLCQRFPAAAALDYCGQDISKRERSPRGFN